MDIVQIDPDKQYVLLLPQANMAQTEQILTSLRAFTEDDVHKVFAIHGTDVTIVPADQVVGYEVLGDGDIDVASRAMMMEEALRVIALSYKYRIGGEDTPPYEHARAVLEKLGISLDSIPDEAE